jgi:hypothetical protein
LWAIENYISRNSHVGIRAGGRMPHRLMNAELQLRHESGRHVEIATAEGSLLWRYTYVPSTPANEAPRPYAHPMYSLSGDGLTNFRPNDHPWHHGLSMTLTSLDEVNFWGGPSYRAEDGYKWRDDHGVQLHRSWDVLSAGRLEETLDWQVGRSGTVLLRERRRLETTRGDTAWSLRWQSDLVNVSGRELTLGNYHALGGLAGSHYTGLQFRGARELLDDHGDPGIGITAEGELTGESAVHGSASRWMEWACQHDGSLRRTRIRFENPAGPIPWFVRQKNPVAAFAFHRNHSQPLAAGSSLRLEHRLTFTSA